MFGTRSTHGTTRNGRHSTHTAGRRGFFSRPRRQNKAAGLKGIEQAFVIAFDRAYTAAINNPNVTSSGRRSAKSQLQHMGVKPPRECMSTKIRRIFHLGGRSYTTSRRARY